METRKDTGFWRHIWCWFAHVQGMVKMNAKFKPIRPNSSLHICQECGEEWIIDSFGQ